jgi:hypothetical protein
MAGIEFDRQVFAGAAQNGAKPAPKVFGALLLISALALAGLVGYKIFVQVSDANSLSAANAQVQQLQAQLAESQKQLEDMKHHKPAVKPEPAVVTPAPQPAAKVPAPHPTYHVAAASLLPPQPKPAKLENVSAQQTLNPAYSPDTAAIKSALSANHDAWQATTDRLADVVGVVGQQQNEITETRDAVNQLLSQTRRQALAFELQRGSTQTPVGPVSLQLKNVDLKAQRYSVCVYFQDRCIELKERVLNEVVVFVVSKDRGPLELVATKILRDQIVGYLQIPVEQTQAR